MTIDQIMQYMVGPPFKKDPESVRKLRISEIRKWFICERDEEGLPEWVESKHGTQLDQILDRWMKHGATEEQAQQLYVAELSFNGTKEEWKVIVDRIMGWTTK